MLAGSRQCICPRGAGRWDKRFRSSRQREARLPISATHDSTAELDQVGDRPFVPSHLVYGTSLKSRPETQCSQMRVGPEFVLREESDTYGRLPRLPRSRFRNPHTRRHAVVRGTVPHEGRIAECGIDDVCLGTPNNNSLGPIALSSPRSAIFLSFVAASSSLRSASVFEGRGRVSSTLSVPYLAGINRCVPA